MRRGIEDDGKARSFRDDPKTGARGSDRGARGVVGSEHVPRDRCAPVGAAPGDVLLPPRLTDLREDQARRERARARIRGKGPRREPRRNDPGKHEDRPGTRLREPWHRHTLGRRKGALEGGRSHGQAGARSARARSAAEKIAGSGIDSPLSSFSSVLKRVEVLARDGLRGDRGRSRAGQWPCIGAGVPSDQAGTMIEKMVVLSALTESEFTGESGASAPQLAPSVRGT